MRTAILLCIAAVLVPMAPAQTGVVTLSGLRDQARPLLIFAAKPDDPQLVIQLRTLQDHAAEAQDRQIVPIAIIYANPSSTDAKLTTSEAESARRRFGIAPDQFMVILVGKDGEEKLRSTKPLSILKLENTIDAMPMRQQEMKRGQRE